MNHLVRLLSLGLLLTGCRSPYVDPLSVPDKLVVRVVNSSPGAIPEVSCALDDLGIGFGRGTRLNPGATARFAAAELETAEVTVQVRWSPAGDAERIELGTVDAPGTTLHLLAPGSHRRIDP